MANNEINTLLAQVLDLLAQDEAPLAFDFERALLGLGASPSEAELLADYIPSACGRAFCRELGLIPPETYERRNKDGSWGPPQRLADDPMWRSVENFVESLRIQSRRQFSLAAQHSSEVNAISNVLEGGKTLTDLRGGHVATVFITPLKHS
jgi:hypothetical protein